MAEGTRGALFSSQDTGDCRLDGDSHKVYNGASQLQAPQRTGKPRPHSRDSEASGQHSQDHSGDSRAAEGSGESS